MTSRAIPNVLELLEHIMDDGAAYYPAFDRFCLKWNWSCCPSCGVSEIMALRDEDEFDCDCYAFACTQDVVGLSTSKYCYLSFGSFGGHIGTHDAGYRLAAALRSIGFVVEWNGDTNHRIKVRLDCFASPRGVAV